MKEKSKMIVLPCDCKCCMLVIEKTVWEDIIGNDVWIGYEAVILSGVTIGDGAIIGTRAVVTKDVPPYTIAGGVPAKPIRKRFSDDTISALLNIKWWDWPKERIARHISDIQAGQIGPLQPLGEM